MKSGISGLDGLYEFKPKQVILVYGPPGPEKSVLIQQFLYAGLVRGEPGIYVTTDQSPQEVRDIMIARGWKIDEFEKGGLLKFVDCYSWTMHEKDRGLSVTMINSPSALSDISISVSSLLKPNTRVVFDSMSTMLLYNDPKAVFRFFQVLGSKIKSAGAIMLVQLEEGMHGEEVRVTLEHLTDGTINVKTSPDHVLRLERIAQTDWVGYKVTDKGMAVLV